MFAVLLPSQLPKQPFWKKWFYKPTQPQIEKNPVFGGGFFYTVRIYPQKTGAYDLSALPQLLGICCKRLLMTEPDALALPPVCAPFSPKLYPYIVFLNTVQRFLRENITAYRTETLGIADVNGLFAARLTEHLPTVRQMFVYTCAPEKYAGVQEAAMQQFGATVVFCTRERIRGCDLQLICSDFSKTGVAGMLKVPQAHGTVLVGDGLLLPPAYAAKNPAGIAPMLFASALYECCNQLPLGDLCHTRLRPQKNAEIY